MFTIDEPHEHVFYENMLGDKICQYCRFAPDGHTDVGQGFLQLSRNCERCGKEYEKCQCKEPIWAHRV